MNRTRLSIIAILVLGLAGVGIAVMPFLPRIMRSLRAPSVVTYPYETRLVASTSPVELPNVPDRTVQAEQRPIPEGKRLVIPVADIDAPIVQGENDSVLSRGIWDQAGTPGDGGNTVLSGHRWQYRPPNNDVSKNLYFLDLVSVGDDIIIYWDGTEYDYRVTDVLEVETDRTDLLESTDIERLTIYTCTPIFSTEHRLVVLAEPV